MDIPSILLAAMILVESGGDATAVGDGGDSIGILQISRRAVIDINRIVGKNRYTLDDRYQVSKSLDMAKAYLSYYGRAYENHTGKKATEEVLARIWNGGYSGTINNPQRTDEYWNKVRRKIDELRGS